MNTGAPQLLAGLSLGSIVPGLVLGLVAYIALSKAQRKHRLGLAAVAFILTYSVTWLWPGSTPAPTAGSEEWPQLLNLLIGLPIFGGLAVMFLPRQWPRVLRGFSYAIFGLTFVASLSLLTVAMTPGWHFQYITPWIEPAGIRWHVAVDGMSVWLVVLTTFTTPIAAFASFGSIKRQIKELCAAFLLLQGFMIGAFVALDLFQFYVFWELMLLPMFLMIGVWGGADRIKASVKFFIYTMTGSVLMLAAMVYMVWTYHKLTGQWSFDLLALMRVHLPGSDGQFFNPRTLCFWAFSLAFFIKVPMWPVHTWLPDAHVQAPTGGSVLLAAVMLKLGTYAYLRFSMTLFPGPAGTYGPTLAGVAVMGGILYGALCAWKQSDVKRLVAYSSVAHLGFVMLGLFGATANGIQGSILQMVNHGIATGALFMLVGVIYDRRHTREVSEFGGIAKVMPIYAGLFVLVTMASIGVPGTNGFVGEFLIITATFASRRLLQFGGIQAIGAAFGVVLAAVYMLGVVQKVFFGPLNNEKNKKLNDITPREIAALSPLIACIFLLGLFPNIMLDRMRPSVEMFQQHFARSFVQLPKDTKAAMLIGSTNFPAPMLKGSPKPKGAADKPKGTVVARGTTP